MKLHCGGSTWRRQWQWRGLRAARRAGPATAPASTGANEHCDAANAGGASACCAHAKSVARPLCQGGSAGTEAACNLPRRLEKRAGAMQIRAVDLLRHGTGAAVGIAIGEPIWVFDSQKDRDSTSKHRTLPRRCSLTPPADAAAADRRSCRLCWPALADWRDAARLGRDGLPVAQPLLGPVARGEARLV